MVDFQMIYLQYKMYSLDTTAKEHVDALHYIILFRIVRMFFGRNLQHCWNGGSVVPQFMPNHTGNMLIDQNDTHIRAGGKALKGFFDLLKLGVLLDN
jgi:hypothetical protein